MIRKIVMACAVAVLAATAADAVEVKLINSGKMTWDITDWGFWIEYEIDGVRFRSDREAGQRTNQLAWELMSEEDKLKVIRAYDMGGNKARIEQFGADGAQKIADKVNDDAGWTEAHKKYTEALVYRDYPTHAAIFNTEQSREEYFNEHFVPHWPDGTEVYWDEEMGQLMAEQHLVWDWATKAFLAVKAGNEKRLDTAAKALSGDLIALICDKVLVPNITFKNPIELGFKYGFRKEVLGALFDYVNSISEAGDMLVKQVVGERASGESGAELIAKVTDLINMNLRLINDCMSRLRANTSEMESMGPRKAAERQRAEQERARQANAVAQEIDQRMEAAPVTGNPPDPAIVEECANYEHTIYQLEKQLEETDDSERKEELSKRIEEKEREYEYYRGSIVTPIPERFASLVSDFSAAMSNLNQRVPYELYPMPSHINDPDYFLDFDFLDVNYHSLYFSFRITPSKAQSDVSEYVQCHTARKAAWPAWCEEYIALVIDYRNRYQEILTDANAINYGGDRYQQFRWQLEKMSENPILHQNQEQEEIDRVQTLLEYYLEAFAQHKETVARNTARREELRSNLELAIQAYEKANDDMLKVLNGLPNFLDGCSADEARILRVPQDSVLYQTVFGDSADGNAARMRQYCREVNELYAQYQGAALRKERARAQIMPMFREFGGLGGTDVEFTDLDIMPPESYPKLHLLRAAVRDFNVQDREGKLLEYYALLANNEDYYAEKRDQFVRAVKSSVRQSANVSAEELPTYAQICSGIVSLMNNPTGFADGIKGYSPDEAGGVFDLLITPIQSAIEGRRNALSWYYSIEGGQAKVFGVEGEVSGTVVIPEAFEGSPVTELGDYLFTGSAMTAVVIPESVVTIGSCAFSGCRQLGAVRIPAKVSSIGEWAFAGCDTLMKFEVAADNAAYRAVNGLLFAKGGTDPIAGIGGDVTVPPGVKRIGTEVFYERTLGSVMLPPGVVEIGERAFAYSTLTEITIPSSVTTIAGDAFYSCDQLVTVYVDKGDNDRVRELLRDAGASLSRITIVSEFTETVDGIEWSYATANGEAVVTWIAEKPEGESYGKVVVPSKLGGLAVTGIGNSVFMWRSDITEVVIPQGVRSIGDYAFNSSPSIKTVTLPRSLTQVGNLTFAYSSLTTVRTAPGDTARMKSLMTKGGLSVSVNWVESDDPAERPEIIDTPTDGAVPQGRCVSLDFEKVLGLEVPADVDYAAGDKVTVKVEGLAKGLKVVATPVYEDPTAKKKVIKDSIYTIEGVPTETVDFDTQAMYARVSVTYKDKTKGEKGKAESLQPIPLSIVPAKARPLAAGVLNEVYEPVDIAELWPEVADAKANPKDWTFKGWPAGIKYKDGTVSGTPTKAGEFPITATHKYKVGKTTVSETFSAVLTVWGDDGATDFRYTDQAYVETKTKTLDETFKSFSGLPAGIKYTTKPVAADAKKGTPEYPAYSLYGTPTKPGVFAVTATKADPDDPSGKKTVKETFLWQVAPATVPTFELDTGTAPVEDLKAQIVQGANQTFAIAASEGAKVTVTGLPTGLKLVQDKTTGLYSVEGVASKPGEYFVTFKTVLNGVTTVTTTAFTVKGNPFAATYCGYACARPAAGAAKRLAVAEVSVAAAGAVKLTYTEGKTKYTASVKSFGWDDVTGKGTAEGLVLKVSSADKKLGYGDRKATVTFEDRGAYLTAKLDIADANGSSLLKWGEAFLYATVKTTEVPLPASQTFVFQTKDSENVDAIATVSVAYDAKKATAAFSGKFFDGTAVKATVPVIRVSDDGTSGDYAFAPFLVIAKDGTVICFENFCGGGGYVDLVREDGEHVDEISSTSAQYALGDKKFAELVPTEGAFTFNWGSDAEVVGAPTESFTFEVTKDKNNKPAGVAIYDVDPQEGEKPLATVTAKVGKLTGAISVSFTSKKDDKAKYAVELVWRGEELFAGHVTRTWKGVVDNKSANLSAYGTAEVK